MGMLPVIGKVRTEDGGLSLFTLKNFPGRQHNILQSVRQGTTGYSVAWSVLSEKQFFRM
jgi:hypothetical protein